MAAPLRKHTKSGELYTRFAHIESLIDQLLKVDDEELSTRIAISDKEHELYIPSECLVHLLRQTKNESDTGRIEFLFRELRDRIIRSTGFHQLRDDRSGEISSKSLDYVDFVLERFTEMLCLDRQNYDDRLDFYEIAFNRALDKLRTDCSKKARVRHKKTQLGLEEDNKELDQHNSVKSLEKWRDQLYGENFDELYRIRLINAINSLPPDERRVIEVLFLDESHDDKLTLVEYGKLLGCGEQTVRNRRDRAIAKLRTALGEDSTHE